MKKHNYNEDIYRWLSSLMREKTLKTGTNQKTYVRIRSTSPKQIFDEIKTNINTKKATGFDLITDEVLKQPQKTNHSKTYQSYQRII